MRDSAPITISLPGPVRGKGRHRSRIAKARDEGYREGVDIGRVVER